MSIKNRSIVAGLLTYSLLFVLLFGAAGTWHWLAGWTFIACFVGASVMLTRWLLVHDPALVEERMHVGKNQQGWDKLFVPAIGLLFLAWFVVMPLDAVRYHWSHMLPALAPLGVALVALAFYLFFVTFRANPFLSGVVRIQEERGHRVITSGPYRFVRHPMYAAALLLFAGGPLWLGSWWGFAVGAALSLLLAVRSVLEERTLVRELAGYEDYRRKVHFRLVPHVW
jgi:protein-S-isoprenylcysteine O-methyltransferase Ste14